MDYYFNNLDSFQKSIKEEENKNELKIKCCDNIENYCVCEEKTICRICNQPINVLNSSPEKCYEGSKLTSRVGMPVSELLPESNTGSVIQQSYISNANMRLISRLNLYNGIPYKVRSLLIVFNQISEACSRNNISKRIINEAQSLYKMISAYKISRGNNRLGLISACVFISCKNSGSPRSSTEISKIMNVSKPVVTRGIKNIQEIIRVNKLNLDRICHNRVNALDLIDRICNNISELSHENINEIKIQLNYFIENYKKELSSCTPPSLAASIINYYILSNNLDIDKNTISKESNVSVVTIQKNTNILISCINS